LLLRSQDTSSTTQLVSNVSKLIHTGTIGAI